MSFKARELSPLPLPFFLHSTLWQGMTRTHLFCQALMVYPKQIVALLLPDGCVSSYAHLWVRHTVSYKSKNTLCIYHINLLGWYFFSSFSAECTIPHSPFWRAALFSGLFQWPGWAMSWDTYGIILKQNTASLSYRNLPYNPIILAKEFDRSNKVRSNPSRWDSRNCIIVT